MASEVGSAYVTLVPSARGFASKMQRELGSDIGRMGDSTGDDYSKRFSSRASSGIKSRSKSIFGGLAKGAAVGVAVAAAGAVKLIGGALSEARDAEVVGARTEGVIKSMGGVAGVSAKQVADLAGSISNKTAIDDEAIQAGQNLLLTFGNVRNEVGKGNDIFNQSSQLMVDMSAAMGTDAKSSAIQLGKALNDPTKGVAALTRSGVSFTQQQKDQIAKLQESGDVLGAQKVILGEVKKQFGGAAESMATPAERAKVAWGNFQEEIGTRLLPIADKVLNALADALPKVLDAGKQLAEKIGPYISTVIGWIKDFVDRFQSGSGDVGKAKSEIIGHFNALKTNVKRVIEIVKAIWESGFGKRFIEVAQFAFNIVRDTIRNVMKVISGVINIVLGLIKGDWSRVWTGIKQVFSGVWGQIKSVVTNGLSIIKRVIGQAWDIIKGIFKRAWDGIKKLVVKGISGVVGLARSIGGKIKAALSALGSILRTIFSNAFDSARDKVSDAIERVVDVVKGIPDRLRALGGMFLDAGKAIIGKFVDGLAGAAGLVSDIAGNVWDAVRGFINSAIVKLNAALEFTINPPGPGSVSINPPDIPQLASGGRARSATLAIIGEGAEAETVLPDSMLRGLLERTAAAASMRGNVAQLTITNWRDGTGYFRLVADEAVSDDARFRRDIGVMRHA